MIDDILAFFQSLFNKGQDDTVLKRMRRKYTTEEFYNKMGLIRQAMPDVGITTSTSGIGYLMTDARQFSKTATVFVCIILLAVIGKAADASVRWLERRLLKWSDSYGG